MSQRGEAASMFAGSLRQVKNLQALAVTGESVLNKERANCLGKNVPKKL